MRCKMLVEYICEKTKFMSPVMILPGENELESLVMGILRVLKKEENACTCTYIES